MESIGRYVRAPPPCDDDGVNRGNNSGEIGREGSEHEFASDADAGAGVEDREGDNTQGYSSGSCDEDATKPKRGGGAKPKNIGYRVQQLEDFLVKLNEKLDFFANTPMIPIPADPPAADPPGADPPTAVQTGNPPPIAATTPMAPIHADPSVAVRTCVVPEPVASSSDTAPRSVRWDNIKPFPDGVPANKLYEQWQRYIRNFEMAADLKQCQGSDHSIAVVADLGKNLKKAISFLARIKEKAKLCGYSAENLDYHVRSQFLKGLANRDIVKDARRYKRSISEIVSAATNDEAYEAVEVPERVGIFAVEKHRGRSRDSARDAERDREFARGGDRSREWSRGRNRNREWPQDGDRNREQVQTGERGREWTRNRGRNREWTQDEDRKRKFTPENTTKPATRRFDEATPKRFRNDDRGRGRRAKCSRCLGFAHGARDCPAMDKLCFLCNEIGHFSVTCRQRRSKPSGANAEQVKDM
ncbi:hypothetical protein quinque_010158 [Culex quinquefasciatus]